MARAFVFADASHHLDPVVEPRVAQNVANAAGRPGLRIPRPEHHPGHARGDDRPRAHRARLEGDVQIASLQPPVPRGAGRLPQRRDLGVAGGVVARLARVAADAEHGQPAHNKRAHGNVARERRTVGQLHGPADPLPLNFMHAPIVPGQALCRTRFVAPYLACLRGAVRPAPHARFGGRPRATPRSSPIISKRPKYVGPR